MRKAALSLLGIVFTSLFSIIVLTGCNFRALKTQRPAQAIVISPETTAISTAIPTPEPSRLLTICMGQEPSSLFLYGDGSQAARTIRQSIYDGPIDIRSYEPEPVILEEIPTLANGDINFEPITVQPGGVLVDSAGQVASLAEGVSYLPSGCADFSCAVAYSGQDSIQVDQQVVRFRLKPGLSWSDGELLKADDSQYSFEVAKSLYPRARPDIIARTSSYLALDDLTVEWKGMPGYHYSGYVASFFTPLPRHAWGALSPQDLLTSDLSSQKPIGWGAYIIDEWNSGDHITLSRNPNYFRAGEGLPHFDRLVFRFTQNSSEAVSALLAGECDYLDETIDLESEVASLSDAQSAGKLTVLQSTSAAWEHLDFGIAPLNPAILPFFQSRETRQAFAYCVDRQKIVDQLFAGETDIPDSYISPDNPMFNPDTKRYSFDPNAAASLLDSIGWRDDDGDPATPRRAQGIVGIPDGTAFEFTFLTSDQPMNQRISEILSESLSQCGISMTMNPVPGEQLFSSGPDGLIFGRNFSLAQFGWMGAWQPPCFLYTTQEIPGPYPEHPKGWGGSNPSGYSNPDFDRACQRANSALPEMPEYQSAQFSAQSIFAEDIPALPLYQHLKRSAQRPDMCGVELESSADSALWNLESFDYGVECNK
jgi:peptide/nickel transport system substrate-binding protein